MRNLSKALVALASIIVSAFIVAPSAVAQDDPTRILLLGDSVTHGFEGEYTWRFFADRSLEQAGASVDFVGPHTGTWSEEDQFGGAYADPDFDTDHAARFGLSMFETLYYSSESAPGVAELMESDTDVMVLTLGFNDLVGINQQPEATIGYARTIIAQARAVNPGVDVVLFALPQVWYDRVPVYNAMLPELAEELSSEASRVVVTPIADLELGVDTYDAAHPTTQGQEKIADAMVEGLADLGIGATEAADLPAPTPTETPTSAPSTPASTPVEVPGPVPTEPQVALPSPLPTAPTAADPKARAPRQVKARKVGGRMVVTWRAGSHADRSEVRCGRVQKVTARQRAKLRVQTASCKVRSINETGSSRWVKARVRR